MHWYHYLAFAVQHLRVTYSSVKLLSCRWQFLSGFGWGYGNITEVINPVYQKLPPPQLFSIYPNLKDTWLTAYTKSCFFQVKDTVCPISNFKTPVYLEKLAAGTNASLQRRITFWEECQPQPQIGFVIISPQIPIVPFVIFYRTILKPQLQLNGC